MNAEYFKSLPKIELHAHLNGSISMKTIDKLLNLDVNSSEKSKLSSNFVLEQPTTMDEVFKMFPLIQSLVQTPETLEIVTMDVIREFQEDGVIYVEIRTTPKDTKYMTKKVYVQTVVNALKKASNKFNIEVGLILSIDRKNSLDEAMETVDMAISDNFDMIVGVELSGNPILDGRKFIPCLEKAKQFGLGVSIHLAEMKENLEEVTDFLIFNPHRIGHGTFLHANNVFVDMIKERKIPFEICLTSNTFCKTTTTILDSHFLFWKKLGNIIAICTDDKGLMRDCELSSEFNKAHNAFNLNHCDLKEICLNSLNISFAHKRLDSAKIGDLRKKINIFFDGKS